MTPLANIFKSIATRTATTASRGRTRARKVAEPHPLLRWDIATRRSPRCAHGGTLARRFHRSLAPVAAA
jgi:hypothetical protein